MNDLHGLSLTTTQAGAAEGFNRALCAYLGYRADLSEHVKAALQADPAFCLGHCLKGYLVMLMYNRATFGVAAEAHRTAAQLASSGATQREQAHVRALGRWSAGDLDGALREWEEILALWPEDALALRLAHFNYFWLGRAGDMRASLERVAPGWIAQMEAYPTLLSCLSFAFEETGDYAAAERGPRCRRARPPGRLGRARGGARARDAGPPRRGHRLARRLGAPLEGKSSIVHHLWWHRALFHLGRRETDAVLELYDRRFRNLASPLVAAMPDLYIDVQNAASMLLRLELRGVPPGDRWTELADKAEVRVGDCLSAFTLPHWMMALAAAGRDAAAARMLEGMREFGATQASTAAVMREVALPVCQAVLAHRRGENDLAAALMARVMDRLHELGGSHAQRDVLSQLYLDARKKAAAKAAA